MPSSRACREARALVAAMHTVIDFERGTVYDDRVASAAPRRAGHRGKPAARPAARRTRSTRGSPDDDDPGEPEPPALCDRCGRKATHVHIVPYVATPDQRVELACKRQDPGGYFFLLSEWLDGDGSACPWRRHLLGKHLGHLTVHLVEERVGEGA